MKEALLQLESLLLECPDVKMFIDFLQDSERGIVR